MYRIFILVLISAFTLGLNAQYDFRSLPMKTDFGTRFHGNASFSDGSYAAIGILEDGINRTSEMVLVKFDCQGQIQWAKTLGGAIGINNTNGGITEADNGDMVIAYSLATGINNSTMLVARYTQEGERVWAKRIGLSAEYARDVTATQDGGFVVVGSTSTFGVDLLRSDIYMVKLDADGEVLWARTLGNNDAFDDAYNVSETRSGDLLVTGRYIVDGTFYHFFLKTDSEGNQQVFKGYGGPLHRNFGFDVQETPEGDYLMTGYTTLAKVDFMSRGDCFLMKVDDRGDIIWANVYEPTERDNNDFGFSIVFEDDGDYGICLESSSFNAISGPQAPNKNVIYTTDSDGNLERVILFNPKGSQYTKMSKAADGGYFVTGFSTYYISSSTAPFNGLAFKTDADYTSGECEEYDRTNQVVTTQVPWDVQDISGEERTNIRVADYAVENDWAFDSAWIICSRIPEIFVEIMPFPDSVCTGENITLGGNPQGGITDYTWDLGSGDTLMGQQVDYAYDTAGAFQIILTATDGCQTVYDTQQIVVTKGEVFDVSRQLCPGDTLVFMDSTITAGGQYTFQGGGMDKCDTTFNLTVTIAVQDTTTDEVTICPNETITYQDAMITDTGTYFIDIPTAVCDSVVILTVNPSEECPCEGEFPAAFSPNGDMVNDTYGMFEIEGGCSPLNLEDFSMVIFNRWGNKVFETNDVNMHWDGRCDGSDCISEVYLVTYSYQINGEVIQRNRDVTLVR